MGCASIWKKVLITIGLILMELTDLGLDWDFFAEVDNTDQEPIRSENALKYSILSFALVGSVSIIFQLVAIVYDSIDDYSNLTFSTTMSFISTWLEDVPQIILAVWVAVISSDLISNVQYAKAIYAIVEALIHMGISIWQLCCKKGLNICLKILVFSDLIGRILILFASLSLLLELHFDSFN